MVVAVQHLSYKITDGVALLIDPGILRSKLSFPIGYGIQIATEAIFYYLLVIVLIYLACHFSMEHESWITSLFLAAMRPHHPLPQYLRYLDPRQRRERDAEDDLRKREG